MPRLIGTLKLLGTCDWSKTKVALTSCVFSVSSRYGEDAPSNDQIESNSEKVSSIMSQTDMPQPEKVVIQFGTRMIKGYLEPPPWNTIEELLSNAPPSCPESFRIRRLESDVVEEISVQDVKAVFYVHSFDGDSVRSHINFHTRTPIVSGIWMRLQFLDGEVMEGIVHNSMRYLVDPGFFLLPTDPGSNNKLVYVLKRWLADHRVLGLRKL